MQEYYHGVGGRPERAPPLTSCLARPIQVKCISYNGSPPWVHADSILISCCGNPNALGVGYIEQDVR
jgi:hypothetical protein